MFETQCVFGVFDKVTKFMAPGHDHQTGENVKTRCVFECFVNGEHSAPGVSRVTGFKNVENMVCFDVFSQGN